jgi:hypothetical protein
MFNFRIVLTIIAGFFLRESFAQSIFTPNQNLTPSGIFDNVFDRFGNIYQLSSLQVNNPNGRLNSSGNTINALSGYSCSAGFFDLYFAAGSCFDGTSAAHIGKRSNLCQVFSDVSAFINSPLSAPSNTVRINIYCDDTSVPGVGGAAGAFYVMPSNPTNTFPGIIQSQITKAIISGNDPYANLPFSVFPTAANFYHGVVYAATNPACGTWNYNLGTNNLGTNTVTSTEVDFYSTFLHEIMHSLGFAALTSSTGVSVFGSSNNYYTKFDSYLKDAGGNYLLSGVTSSCTNISYTASATVVNPGNCSAGGTLDVSTCSLNVQYASPSTTVSVFTPTCWVGGSSLSHFEDMCTVSPTFTTSCVPTPTSPGYNNLYFVMSNGTSCGGCFVERFPKEEERYVLCDLGYSVKNTFTSTAIVDGTLTSHAYTASACPGLNVWGVNDGLSGGVYIYTSNTTSLNIPLNFLLAND